MKKIDVAIVDYGMGNLRSVLKAFEHVAPDQVVVVTSNAEEVKAASRVVFPGQGAMPDCIRELDSRGLREAVVDAAYNKPFLGICIGLQMLFVHSQEGDVAGLGLFEGDVKHFTNFEMIGAHGEKLKVPHMGWNQVFQQHQDGSVHSLWAGIPDGQRFYYVHSYYVQPDDQHLEVGFSLYPKHFTGAIAKENLFAVQFHPEKSADAGLQLLKNFTLWQPLT
jgi:imidazole glycerol-phosphate synthase subunit HisH